MSILGLNILGDRGISEDYIAAKVQQLNARYHVVMNNPGLADRLQKSGTQVIYRFWPDDGAHEETDPRAWVQEIARRAPPNTLLYLGNEPRKGTLKKLNDWTVLALDECEKLGRKGVIFNFATGNPEPEEWQILREAVVRAHANGHFLGLHQYFDVRLDNNNSFPWHVGRDREVRAAFGAQTPPIIITELGCAVDFHPLKGWQLVMTADQYAEQLGKAADHYIQHGIFACLFALAPNNDQSWGSFNPTDAVIDRMAAHNARLKSPGLTPPPVQPPTNRPPNIGEPSTGEVQTSTYIRVRSQPALSGAEIARAEKGQKVNWFPASQRTADNFDWVFVELLNADNSVRISGWMARVWETWETQFGILPPDPATPPAPPAPDVILVPVHPQMPEPAPRLDPAVITQAQQIRQQIQGLAQIAPGFSDDIQPIVAQLEQLIAKLENASR